jgi:hypothetical protein
MNTDYLIFVPWLCVVCWLLWKLIREDCRG